ncbi:glycoside hydrolase superfamily [Gilbertella persicaria]|uniref:glycoside hydrolase superfamily n=1 Tax=Gilbertella persicaria TaxID=101096 RepID=UPI00221E8383|nr:glycoside hydrolase superfamily [Gilbertella persicaria]XP_051430589.1 glycoside hydrolase superfamily [Gilbertella persicaria]KAI8055606.1 glycoside hydrolase superfamily [Gilbertella persicaria]KAI8057517.1 glycoside hydrolase superfamily [Gilbertella persicaria]
MIYRYLSIAILILSCQVYAQTNFTLINQHALEDLIVLPERPFSRQEIVPSIRERKDGLALYWGQGDFGEKRLSYYCDQEGVSIMILSFIADYAGGPKKQPILDLSDNCNNVNNCIDAAKDIKYCQSKGIKVLVSLGGAVGPYHRQAWDPDLLAWWMWNKYLGGRDHTVTRPFGDVVLDGVDYDPEAVDGTNYDRHIDTLRKLFKTEYPTRDYLITAAPQCPDLDYYSKNAVYNILHPRPGYDAYPDIVFVQFYNNNCAASGYNPSRASAFNFDEWNTWAQKSESKVYLGVMGKENHMDTGYVTYEKLTVILDDVQRSKSFGGVMMWDASYAYSNPVPYLGGMQYGQAAARYLKQLSTPSSARLANAFSGINLAFKEFKLPILVPVGGKNVEMLPLPCAGQPFLLLRAVTGRSLAESFGSSAESVAQHLESLGMNGDHFINPGSYVCMVSKPRSNDSLVIGYVYNSTMTDDLTM